MSIVCVTEGTVERVWDVETDTEGLPLEGRGERLRWESVGDVDGVKDGVTRRGPKAAGALGGSRVIAEAEACCKGNVLLLFFILESSVLLFMCL